MPPPASSAATGAGSGRLCYTSLRMASTEPTPSVPPDEPATPATPSGNSDDDRGYDVPAHTWMVHGAIIVAFAVFITVVSLLFVRWWTGTKVPNSSLEFIGDERLRGVQVRVDGTNLDAARTQKLSAENGYRARFALPAGLYLVRVSQDDTLLVGESTVSLRESDAFQFDLTRLKNLPTTAPSETTTPEQQQP